MISRTVTGKLAILGRDRVLAAVLFDWLLLNTLIFKVDGLPEWFNILVAGAWIFEPMLLAVWAVMGPGSSIIRLSLVIPSLMLLITAPGIRPGGFDEIELYEFKVIAIVGMVIFAVTSLLMLGLRWFFGWQIVYSGDVQRRHGSRFQFDIKYLITLLTLCAIVLGIMSNPVFKQPEPTFLFGPEFFVHIAILGSTTAFFVLLPVLAVPLIVLNEQRSKRALAWALGIWNVVTFAVCAVWLMFDDENMLPLAVLLQLGGFLFGTLTALLLMLAGYRLHVRP